MFSANSTPEKDNAPSILNRDIDVDIEKPTLKEILKTTKQLKTTKLQEQMNLLST